MTCTYIPAFLRVLLVLENYQTKKCSPGIKVELLWNVASRDSFNSFSRTWPRVLEAYYPIETVVSNFKNLGMEPDVLSTDVFG